MTPATVPLSTLLTPRFLTSFKLARKLRRDEIVFVVSRSKLKLSSK